MDNPQDEMKSGDAVDAANEIAVVERRASCELIIPKMDEVDAMKAESELMPPTKDKVEEEEVQVKLDPVTESSTATDYEAAVREATAGVVDATEDVAEVVLEEAAVKVGDSQPDVVVVEDIRNNGSEEIPEGDVVEVAPETNIVEERTSAAEPESFLEEISDVVDDVSHEESVSKEVAALEEVMMVEAAAPDVTVAQETVTDGISVNGMPVLTKEVEGEEPAAVEEIEAASATTVDAESEVAVESVDHPETIETVNAEAKPHKEESVERSIPPHILGHNIDNSNSEDPVRNGKVRKPRLGVKIPYRNLTSQIVTKQDIADEIMERSRIRNASADIPEGGDLFFTKKLTKRLANKISSPSKSSDSVKKSSPSSSSGTSSSANKQSSESKTSRTTETPKEANVGPPKKIIDTSSKITDNTDLLAILEGDDDTDWTLAHPTKSKRTPEWERETALKQLRELPKHGKNMTVKVSPAAAPTPTKLEKAKSNTPPKATDEDDPLLITLDDNSEPRFSIGSVTKTYTRKRNLSGDMKFLASSILQTQKKASSDKDGGSSSSPAKQTEKKAGDSSSTKTTSKSSIPKPSVSSSTTRRAVKHAEMPSLKKESSSPKTEKRPPAPPKLVANQSPVDATQPQIKLDKDVVESDDSVSKKPAEAQAQLSPNTYISKSSRIVKRKKIWDPDEDVTPKYFKSPPVKSPKPVDAAAAEKSAEKKIERSVKVDSPQAKVAVLKPSNEKTSLMKKPLLKKVIMKKNKPKPKRLTEVDRLLMDEGAVNLLYSVKNTDELQNIKKKKSKSTISLDRAQRELLNKTNEIKNDLQINSTKDSPISLRKKEPTPKTSPIKDAAATILQRKKSTGSTNSPPASPAFYNQHAEASRIIRRHSSSSFSSDNQDGDDASEKGTRSQRKKVRTHAERHSVSIIVDKQLLSEEMAKNFNTTTTALPGDNDGDPKFSEFETFSVRTFKHFVQIILSPSSLNGQTLLSIDALMELRSILHILKKDDECRVVLFSSSGDAFCQGLDYTELACDSKSERLNICENYAICVRDLLTTISKFPKILVAGVHGNTVGLGVTMLPLFDMVLASDTATFSTPYATLGCAAEGGVLLTLPHVMHGSLASELFFASRSLTASEALRLGLVTRTLWPDKFQEELIAALKTVSGQSLQSMLAIKKQLRQHLYSKIESSLKEESLVLVQHWTSKECQQNFINYKVESK